MRWSCLWVCLIAIGLSSCEEKIVDGPEAVAIRQAFQQQDEFFDAMDGEAVVAMMAESSVTHYDALIELALNGSRDQLLQLRPTDLSEVIRIRNRLEPEEVLGMSSRELLVRAVDDGWYSFEEDDEIPEYTLGRIDVAGERASAMVLEDGVKTGHFADFYLEGGQWKFDFQSWDTLWDSLYVQEAKDAEMSVADLILAYEDYEVGLRQEVDRWIPMSDW